LHDEQLEGLRLHGTVLDVEVDGPAQQANAGRSPSKNLAAPRLGGGSRPAGLRGALRRLNPPAARERF
jgi:hypothetical protein